MIRLAPSFIALAVYAAPLCAQEDRGLSLIERGAELFMEGILREIAPALEEFEGLADQMAPALRLFADEMGPKLAEILDQVEDWSAYQPPRMLPNGDIIIRRKPDRPLEKPEVPRELPPQIDL